MLGEVCVAPQMLRAEDPAVSEQIKVSDDYCCLLKILGTSPTPGLTAARDPFPRVL